MKLFHILLVEDNLGDILLFQTALDAQNVPHEVHVVRDGEEALTFLDTVSQPNGNPRPDVILLDLNLPKIDGVAVLAAFCPNPVYTGIPIIAVTSSDSPRDRARVKEFGVATYFRKPLDLEEFMKIGPLVFSVINASGVSDQQAVSVGAAIVTPG